MKSKRASLPGRMASGRTAAEIYVRAKFLGALFVVLTLSACRSANPPPADALIPVGAAAVDITPTESIRLSGYGNRREPSEGIAQRIHAKALAFGGKEGPAVVVAADLVGVSSAITDEVARRLADAAGVEREDFVLTVTHTHAGPQLSGVLPNLFGEPIPAEHERVIEQYTERLIGLLEQVALDALADRRPAQVAWTRGSVDFAANRRVLEDGAWTGFGINPEGPVDHSLPVMTVRAPDGSLRAVWVSYACHCTTLSGGTFNQIHGDWAGTAQQELEARHEGLVALVTIGCGADQNPNPRGELDDVYRHGRAVADEVDRLLQGPTKPLAQAPSGAIDQVALAFADVPTLAEWQAMAGQEGAAGYHAEVVVSRGGREPDSLGYPVQTWTFARDLAVVFLGGEVVVDYAIRLKRELDPERLWIVAYSNDVMCYIASDRLMDEGGYEVDQSMHYYDQPSRLAYGTEERIVDAVRALLPDGFERDGAP